MQLLFAVCFIVGVGYTLIGFLMGEILDFFDFDADLDLEGGVSPIKPVIVAAFITVFGGVGLIMLGRMSTILVFSTAGFFGLVVSYAMHKLVIVPLHKAQNTSAVEIQTLIGSVAKVTETILQGKYGQITYHVNGNTYSSPAKAEDGSQIARNTDVEIVSIVKNTYFVRKREAN